MNKLELIGKVVNKKLTLSKQQIDQINGNLAFYSAGEKVFIEISKYNEKRNKELKRTEQQNKYYHKLLDIICDYTGSEHLEIHNELKCMFLVKPWIREDKEYLIVGSTRDLKPSEFGDYLSKVFEWASRELGLILPDSEDYY